MSYILAEFFKSLGIGLVTIFAAFAIAWFAVLTIIALAENDFTWRERLFYMIPLSLIIGFIARWS